MWISYPSRQNGACQINFCDPIGRPANPDHRGRTFQPGESFTGWPLYDLMKASTELQSTIGSSLRFSTIPLDTAFEKAL
jgi:hypothetical protein